jgi:hypothetical protein
MLLVKWRSQCEEAIGTERKKGGAVNRRHCCDGGLFGGSERFGFIGNTRGSDWGRRGRGNRLGNGASLTPAGAASARGGLAEGVRRQRRPRLQEQEQASEDDV